jgi:hypothetical protein
MSNRRIFRHWVGECQFPGKKRFYVGTVQAFEEREALTALEALWHKTFPYPFPPKCIAVPGLLAFVPEEQDTK